MVTSNALQRTFRIKYRNSCGTCFTVDESGRQYLITAKHILTGISVDDLIEVFYDNSWHSLSSKLVGDAAGDIDITVLALSLQLSPPHPLPATTQDIIFGQGLYFLGFPYNLFADIGVTNRNFPLPFIKRGVLSSMITDAVGAQTLFLDGHNNPGFSGGPVVFTPPGRNEYRVAAVISGYRYEEEPVYAGDQPTSLAYRYNTGIIISYGIRHAIEIIQSNPIGFLLP